MTKIYQGKHLFDKNQARRCCLSSCFLLFTWLHWMTLKGFGLKLQAITCDVHHWNFTCICSYINAFSCAFVTYSLASTSSARTGTSNETVCLWQRSHISMLIILNCSIITVLKTIPESLKIIPEMKLPLQTAAVFCFSCV